MPCEQCGEREAVVHLTQIAEDQVTVIHLCERCAAERGFDTGASAAKTPLGGFLATLSTLADVEAAAERPARCPACGAAFEDFRATGRLGCPTCYSTFDGALRELMRRLHGATVHTGERYVQGGGTLAAELAVKGQEELQTLLREAVAAEDFERAAELRDRIRGLRA
jgi:protein arginine kinase activator